MLVLDQPTALNTLKYIIVCLFAFNAFTVLPFFSFLFMTQFCEELNCYIFLLVVVLFAGFNHGVELRYHDGTLSNGAKHPPGQLVDKVAECVVVLLLSLHVLNRQLQLILHFPHEEVVYHYVIGWIIELVLDSHQLEFTLHVLAAIQNVHGLKQTDEGALAALVL